MVHPQWVTRSDSAERRPVGAHPAVVAFAAELRELRAAAGSPSFRQMARTTFYSSTSLAEATRGIRMPTEGVVAAFATACGAEPLIWTARLHRAMAAASEPAAQVPEVPDASTAQAAERGQSPGGGDGAPQSRDDDNAGSTSQSPGDAPQRRIGLWAAVALVIFAAGLLGGGFAGSAMTGTDTAAARPLAATATPAGPAADGADPVVAGCVPDVRLVESVPVLSGGRQVGVLQMEYSPRCAAAWARAYLLPGQPDTLIAVRIEESDGDWTGVGLTMHGTEPIYTDVVRADGGCLTGLAQFGRATAPSASATLPCVSP